MFTTISKMTESKIIVSVFAIIYLIKCIIWVLF